MRTQFARRLPLSLGREMQRRHTGVYPHEPIAVPQGRS